MPSTSSALLYSRFRTAFSNSSFSACASILRRFAFFRAGGMRLTIAFSLLSYLFRGWHSFGKEYHQMLRLDHLLALVGPFKVVLLLLIAFVWTRKSPSAGIYQRLYSISFQT